MMHKRTRPYWPLRVGVLLALVLSGVAGAAPLNHIGYAQANVSDEGAARLEAHANGQPPSARSTPAVDSLQIGTQASTSSLSLSATTITYGQSVALTAQVSAVPPATGTPTGYVLLAINGLPNPGFLSLNPAGEVQFVFGPGDPRYAAGSFDIIFGYQGDANFAPSVSPDLDLTIDKASVTVTVSATPDSSAVNQPYTVNFTVQAAAPGAGTPTGTVTVTDGTDNCSAAVSAGSCQLTSTTAGPKTLLATYSGDPNFLFGSGFTQHTVTTLGAVPRVPYRIAIPMIVNAR